MKRHARIATIVLKGAERRRQQATQVFPAQEKWAMKQDDGSAMTIYTFVYVQGDGAEQDL